MLESIELIWIAALPVLIWLALERFGPPNALLEKSLKTCFLGIAAWLAWFALVAPPTCFFTRQMTSRAYIESFWLTAVMLPPCIWFASRLAARASLRQAAASAIAALLWAAVLWGLMVGVYFIEYAQSPAVQVTRHTSLD